MPLHVDVLMLHISLHLSSYVPLPVPHAAPRPSGSRLVAGRVIRESYGSLKQQHTFTVEVSPPHRGVVEPQQHTLQLA